MKRKCICVNTCLWTYTTIILLLGISLLVRSVYLQQHACVRDVNDQEKIITSKNCIEKDECIQCILHDSCICHLTTNHRLEMILMFCGGILSLFCGCWLLVSFSQKYPCWFWFIESDNLPLDF
jgi:hypothetical protein